MISFEPERASGFTTKERDEEAVNLKRKLASMPQISCSFQEEEIKEESLQP
jgi:hypothetical protein